MIQTPFGLAIFAAAIMAFLGGWFYCATRPATSRLSILSPEGISGLVKVAVFGPVFGWIYYNRRALGA